MMVNYVNYSNSGKKICSCSIDSMIIVWNLASQTLETKLIGHKFMIRMISFNEDDSRILSCGNDSTIRVWCLQS